MPTASERVVLVMLVTGLVGYAAEALAAHRWISGLAAPIIAVLLAVRHPRARFSAYVFFTALVLRALMVGGWAVVAFGAVGVLVLQTPPARRAWPRLTPGHRRGMRDTP
jgi:hypothetical protein